MPKTTYLTLDRKCRTTLPEEVREALGVGPGDFILLERTAAGTYELVPAELVPKDQRWFYHPEIQARVRAAEEELRTGRSRRTSAGDFEKRFVAEKTEAKEKRRTRRRRP